MPLLFAYGINRFSHDVAHVYKGMIVLRISDSNMVLRLP